MGGSLPLTFLPAIPIRTPIPNSLLDPLLPAPRSIHRSRSEQTRARYLQSTDDDSPGPARRVYPPPES